MVLHSAEERRKSVFTVVFLKQVAERMVTGAVAGAGGAYVAGMSAYAVSTWTHLGEGAIWGAFVALVASVGGSQIGSRTSPLASAPADSVVDPEEDY